MIPLLLLCLCILDPIAATSAAKELPVAEQDGDSLDAQDDTAMEKFSHLISIIGSKGPRSEKRLARLSLTRLNFNTLYTNGSPELKESLNTLTQNLTRALTITAWSTHTKEIRVNALLRMAFTDLEALAENNAQRELVLTLQKNLNLGLAPALTGLRETLRKKLPLKTLLALAIIATGGFAAYKMSLGKKILHKVIDTTKKKLSKEFAAMEHLGELARTNEAEVAAYEQIRSDNQGTREIINPRTGHLELHTAEATYVRPQSSVNKAIHAFHTATSIIPHVTERLAAETAKDTAWFNQYNIRTNPDGSRKMVRVHYGAYDEMRYLSSEPAEDQTPDQTQQESLKLHRDSDGRWYKTYIREPLVKTILGQVDRSLTMADRILPLAETYRPLLEQALQLAEQYREMAHRGMDIFENPIVTSFIDSIGTITKTNLAQTFTWLKSNNFIREGGTTPGDLAADVRSRFNESTRTMTFYKVDEGGDEIVDSAKDMPKNIIDSITTIITQLTANGSASAELIKAITQQIRNGLENTRLFLSEIELWDTEANKIKASLSSTNTAGESQTFPIAYGQDNGKPYYEVALAAFSAETQTKLMTKARETQEAITMAREAGEALNNALRTKVIIRATFSKTPKTTAGTPGRGAGAGSGTSATPEQSTHKPIMYDVYIQNDMVKIYIPISAVERLFLTLDKIEITNPINFVQAVLEKATNFRRDSIDEILSVLHGGLASRLIDLTEQEKRVHAWRLREATATP